FPTPRPQRHPPPLRRLGRPVVRVPHRTAARHPHALPHGSHPHVPPHHAGVHDEHQRPGGHRRLPPPLRGLRPGGPARPRHRHPLRVLHPFTAAAQGASRRRRRPHPRPRTPPPASRRHGRPARGRRHRRLHRPGTLQP